MDFNRGGQFRLNSTPAGAGKATNTSETSSPQAASNGKKMLKGGNRLVHWSYLALLISGTILFVAMIFFVVFGAPGDREAKYVESDKYQAVFVNVDGTNGGQVYFGRITSLTPKFIRLTNVFYIQNQQTGESKTSSAYNLVKLGCELHGPADEMLINRDQVFFWENLKNESQVAQKAAEFYKQNPNGQKCETNSTTNSTTQSTQAPAETTGTGATTNATTTNKSTDKTTQ